MKNNNSNRNLIVIGNGFDLSLEVPSSFRDYIGVKDFSDCKGCKKYQKIVRFIKLYHNFQNELQDKIYKICRKFHVRLKPLFLIDTTSSDGNFITQPVYIVKKDNIFQSNKDNTCFVGKKYGFRSRRLFPKKYFIVDNDGYLETNSAGFPLIKKSVALNPGRLSVGYFILKLIDESYRITSKSFIEKDGSDLGSSKYPKVCNALDKLDKWGNNCKKLLSKASANINTNRSNKQANYWILLMLFDMYIDLSNKSKDDNTFPKTWYDVENTIKEYLISIINFPVISDYHKNKYYMINHKYHDIYDYIHDADSYSLFHFMFFTCINRSLDLLTDVDIQMCSGDCRDYSYHNIDSYLLYDNILNYSDYNEFLIHYVSKSPSDVDDVLGVVNPFMFLLLDKFHYFSDRKMNEINRSFFSFLRKQLRAFENDFSIYLKNQLTDDYRRKSLDHLNKLSVTRDLANNNQPFNLLDFNYTPVSKSVKHCEHIHGTLNNKDIIIGIGEQKIDNFRTKISNKLYDELYSFTKTYKLFNLNEKSDSDFLNNVQNIIFFGHSFGVNDFPYFEALFDHFHLYSNPNVNLIFSYKGHGKETYEESKRKLVPKIIHLLKIYSRSLSNKAHGENLISRMFAENRIRLYAVHFDK